MAEDVRSLDYLRRTTAALRHARQQLKELEDVRSEPVAVVGVALRLPEGVDDPGARRHERYPAPSRNGYSSS
jgi:hypothetical protein